MAISVSKHNSGLNLGDMLVSAAAVVGGWAGYFIASAEMHLPFLSVIGMMLLGIAFGLVIAGLIRPIVSGSAEYSTLLGAQVIGMLGLIVGSLPLLL